MAVTAFVEAEPPASRTGLAATCDQTGIVTQIQTTHFPDGKQVQVNGLLTTIKDILSLCGYHTSSEGQKEDPTSLDYSSLQSIVEQLSTELAFTTLNAADVHPKALSFFNMLSNYEWDAKLCLILAALVTIYGDYWVLMQSCSGEQLAKDMVTLLQLKERVAESDEQKSWFDKLKNLMMSMVDLAEQIAKMKALMSSSSADEATIRIATNTMVVASYWTVRNVVLCTSYIHSLFGKAYKSSVGPGDIDTMTKKICDLQAACQEMTKSLLGHVIVPAKEIKVVACGGSTSRKEWTYKPEGAIAEISIVHEGAIESISFSSVKPDGGVVSAVKFGGDGGGEYIGM